MKNIKNQKIQTIEMDNKKSLKTKYGQIDVAIPSIGKH